MVAMFIDLKAAFDSVNRGILVKAMEEREVRGGLIRRIEEVIREMICRIRAAGEVGEEFWMARGVRQGCPLSPTLLNLLIADMEEEMGKVKWGEVKIGDKRIYTLAYADNIVLLAEEEEGMRSMIGRLEEYLDRKRLKLNAGRQS